MNYYLAAVFMHESCIMFYVHLFSVLQFQEAIRAPRSTK